MVEELCEVLATGPERDPVWLASYALWRLNWIHPFGDGNGRTARMVCHVVLSVSLGFQMIPGQRSLPDRILAQKIKYWRCLEAADEAFKRRKTPNVSNMRGFIGRLLEEMLSEGAPG